MRPLLRLTALLAVALATFAAPAAPVTRADSAFFPLAGGSFAQDWSNAALIATDNDWSAVPSLTGYRGDGLTGATGANPQEILADGSLTPVSLLANESSPDALDTGGVAEFDAIANPAVALSGSGTADAPHLLLALDATGRQNIVVSYTLRDLDGSSDDAAQPVALQYRVGSGVEFTNLPAGFVADATEPGAAKTTPVSVTLPIAANNQPQLQLRIITANAAGSDEWVGVDDILVTSDLFDGTIVPCAAPDTSIAAVQGSGATAAITGTVTVQGVVVGDYEGPSPNLRGFYLQQIDGDGDPATSEGIFVFSGSGNVVTLGQVVQVTGTAAEFQDQTQISAASVESCGTTAAPAPAEVTLPVPEPVGDVPYLERFEGMLVRLPQTLAVTEHFQLGRFGQVTLSAGGRLRQPTNIAQPGAAALALQAANDRNQIILDDAQNGQNPDPILFGRGGSPLSAANTLRGGDSVTGVVGVLSYTWAGNSASPNAYRVRPVGALGGGVPSFAPANPRPGAAPEVGGSVRVAGMNLLNYFNTFADGDAGTPGCFPSRGDGDCRGAESQAEFDRQWPKTVQAIVGTGADVIGVNELENDGYGPASSIQDLVNRLNDATAPGTYAFVDADAATGGVGALGSDAIRVAIIYKPGRVTPLGTAVLNTGAFGLFTVSGGSPIQRNRPALAQTFADASGERFTVAVSHLKSKGSGCASNISPVGPDPDTGDGQGNCNLTRTRAAEELAAWLATDPTESGDADVLIVGDLNSYAKEDPVTALVAAGYTNLIATRLGEGAYSYVFDGQWGYLDHALASLSLAGQVTGVAEWHINADEPNVLDYNTDFKSPGQIAGLYAADQYRVSDHDPVVVGLQLGEVPLYLPLVGR